MVVRAPAAAEVLREHFEEIPRVVAGSDVLETSTHIDPVRSWPGVVDPLEFEARPRTALRSPEGSR